MKCSTKELKEAKKVSNTKKIDEPVFEIDDELKKIYLISNPHISYTYLSKKEREILKTLKEKND